MGICLCGRGPIIQHGQCQRCAEEAFQGVPKTILTGSPVANVRDWVNDNPSSWRLCLKKNGSLVLQSRHEYQRDGTRGYEWRDVPIFVEKDEA